MEGRATDTAPCSKEKLIVFRALIPLFLLFAGSVLAEPCGIPRKNCKKESLTQIVKILQTQSSKSERSRNHVVIEQKDGTKADGIVLSWSPDGVVVGTAQTSSTKVAFQDFTRITIVHKKSVAKKAFAATALGYVGLMYGALGPQTELAAGLGLGAGIGLGVGLAGRGKIVELEVR